MARPSNQVVKEAQELVRKGVQRRMMRVLSDGAEHSREELHACLEDELGDGKNIGPHLFHLRKAIAGQGLVVVCTNNRGMTYYQLRRYVSSSSE